MICQFTFKNFKSYKDETEFDFQAAALPEFADNLIIRPKCSSLLPVSVIYGPNGGGKSNLLQALGCLVSVVVEPIHELQKNRTSIILQEKIESRPFLFDEDSRQLPTEFQIYFRTGEYEYRYNLSLLRDEVVAESLHRLKIGAKKTACLFTREGSAVELGASINKSSINRHVNPKMPYLSFLAINYDLPVIAEVQSWFERCIVRSYGTPVAEQTVLLEDTVLTKKSIIMLLNDMGIDITDYRYDHAMGNFYLQRVLSGKPYEIAFSEESDGTRKLFAALPVVLLAIKEGRPLVIDELDAKLHPKLLRYVISLFKDPDINQHGAQILFTSHDMSTMKNDVFRRDEIWFAAADAGHKSELYSLYEIRREDHQRINNTAAYDKQYMEGRYGADPYLSRMLNWEVL